MLYANQSLINVTAGQKFLGLFERVMISTLTTVPCCVFIFINGVMLFTLRSKTVFRETSRYILLFNLLFADTVQMVVGQLLYLLSACRITLTYPVCGFLIMLAKFADHVSPLTLVVMSLERYVAVCYPLKHSAIITIRNTAVAIIVVWIFSSLNILTQVLLLLEFPFEDLESLQMTYSCGTFVMILNPVSDDYDKAYTCFLFVSSGTVVTSSYIGVMIAARSASTDKASAQKSRNTLLLHLVQLGLSLMSTMYNSMLIALSRTVTRIVLVRSHTVLYVCIFIFPRCLSSLIYGIRDHTIRPVLMYHLCCRLKLSVISAKVSC